MQQKATMVIHMQILLAMMNDISPSTEYERLYNQIPLYSILLLYTNLGMFSDVLVFFWKKV